MNDHFRFMVSFCWPKNTRRKNGGRLGVMEPCSRLVSPENWDAAAWLEVIVGCVFACEGRFHCECLNGNTTFCTW